LAAEAKRKRAPPLPALKTKDRGMTDQSDTLARIADALERLAPPRRVDTDWRAHPAYVLDTSGPRPVEHVFAPALDLLRGIDAQKEVVTANIARLAAGHAAHDMLLWGARGMGKSALLRASVAHAQTERPGELALVQVAQDAMAGIAGLFLLLSKLERRFLVYIDDLGFEEGDDNGPRRLRSWLEGGVEARPGNVRLAVTSNRRAIVPRHASEQNDPINPRDAVDDKLALADRFGLAVGFHNCSQDDYLAIIAGYAASLGLAFDPADALEWSRRRGQRSGRVASHYVTELAGRAGKAV
jgi:predicted AAA+ superfamily ATPase